MTALIDPILVEYDCSETDAERRDRIKKGEAARTYSFMVVTVSDDKPIKTEKI